MTESVPDPENSVSPHPADLAETAVDEADDFERGVPLEAEPADVLEQKLPVDDGDDDGYDRTE